MTRLLAALYICALSLTLSAQTIQADTTQPSSTNQDGSIESVYLIQPGDVLEISVWNEDTLLRQALVRPDGGLSFPLAGDIQAAGKSIPELNEIIAERLIKYIPDPVVTVSVQQLSGNKVYVIGKVARPGEFVANRYIDVVQALSVAGGMTPFSSVNNIKILRRENGKLIAIPFRYGDVEDGENLEQNILLKSGDVVLVP